MQLLCSRCVLLTHGHLIRGVDDRQTPKEEQPLKQLLSPEELRGQLKSVRDKKVLVVLLVDLLDLPGSFLNSIRPLIGMNPIFLIGTKMDLLPQNTSFRGVLDWLRQYALAKKLNVVDLYLVSNRKKTGIPSATSTILRMRNGRDVYVMGLANVGKSAFVRAFLNEMRTLGSVNFTPDAHSKGTTLGIIKLRALKRKGAVYGEGSPCFDTSPKICVLDTPGVHVFHRLTHLLTPETLRRLLPGRPLSPYIPPTPYEICKQLSQKLALADANDSISEEELVERIMADPDEVSATYFWGGLVRIDIFEAPPSLGLAFFGASVLRVHAFPLLQPDPVRGFESEESINTAVVNGEMREHVVSTRILEDIESVQTSGESSSTLSVEDLSYDPFEDLSAFSSADADQTSAEAPAKQEVPARSPEQVEQDASGAEMDVSDAFFGRECGLDSGWIVAKSFEIECLGFEEALVDISVSGLPGWISVTVPRVAGGRDTGWLKGRVWAPRGVEVFLRTPIPVSNPLMQTTRSRM